MSANGRCVAFSSSASNLVPGGPPAVPNLYLRDTLTQTTEYIVVAMDGGQPNNGSGFPSLSSDGRYVAFASSATNLVADDTNNWGDIFVRDRQLGTTERVNVSTAGVQANAFSDWPSISGDGRYVAFMSGANTLTPNVLPGVGNVYVHDRLNHTTQLVSVPWSGPAANFNSLTPSISATGQFIAFQSAASNLIPVDTNQSADIFVRDIINNTTELVSRSWDYSEHGSDYAPPVISGDGRYVAFVDTVWDLVPNDNNGFTDVFVRDRVARTTERVSIASDGSEGNQGSGNPRMGISADGRYVAFQSVATNLVPGITTLGQVYVHDRTLDTTECASISTGGAEGDAPSGWNSIALSWDGTLVCFESGASNLIADDTNSAADIFVRDRRSFAFVSECDPGMSGVQPCPCGNPPSFAGRGCDNSSQTGGGFLQATGVASLSTDSLVFTTYGQRPTALSIVMQGNGLIQTGVTYGQGVRCVGGSIIRRLFSVSATGGSITVPHLVAGDSTISARSAEKGDVIQPGQSRWYLVYYRDPYVLGGCPATSNFNATQTGQVTWSP